MLPIQTILHPTDFSEHSGYAFRVACSLARDCGSRLVVVHVMSLPLYASPELGPLIPAPTLLEEELRERLLLLRPLDPAVAVDHCLLHGDAAAEIIRLAKDDKSDLIVMGTHGRTGLGRFLMGSVAEAVRRRAPCPVLTLTVPFPADVAAVPTSAEPAHA